MSCYLGSAINQRKSELVQNGRLKISHETCQKLFLNISIDFYGDVCEKLAAVAPKVDLKNPPKCTYKSWNRKKKIAPTRCQQTDK